MSESPNFGTDPCESTLPLAWQLTVNLVGVYVHQLVDLLWEDRVGHFVPKGVVSLAQLSGKHPILFELDCLI